MSPETARRLDAALRQQPWFPSRKVPQSYQLVRIDCVYMDSGGEEMVLHYEDTVPDSERPKWAVRATVGRLLVAWFEIV
jgi:hypothetical protein